MKLTADQLKDLRSFKAKELKLGGYFYVKKSENDYQLAMVTEYDMKHFPMWTRTATSKLSAEGSLFVRINQPWKTFE